MKTGIIYSEKSLNHDTGDSHPENKFRIQSILEKLKKGDNSKLAWSKPSKLDEIFLKKTHNSQYISEVKFEYQELLKLFKEDSNIEKIIEEDSGEND